MPSSVLLFTKDVLGAQPARKRNVGRPIAYCGDPNSPDLTPGERRRIMRRIANRESARRVRARCLGRFNDMAKQVGDAICECLDAGPLPHTTAHILAGK